MNLRDLAAPPGSPLHELIRVCGGDKLRFFCESGPPDDPEGMIALQIALRENAGVAFCLQSLDGEEMTEAHLVLYPTSGDCHPFHPHYVCSLLDLNARRGAPPQTQLELGYNGGHVAGCRLIVPVTVAT